MREKADRKTREDDGNECHGRPIIHTAGTIFPDGLGGVALHSINACFFLCPHRRQRPAGHVSLAAGTRPPPPPF